MLFELFAVQNLLYVTFTTIKRTAPVFNRGFFALYEFSDNYVKLGSKPQKCDLFFLLIYSTWLGSCAQILGTRTLLKKAKRKLTANAIKTFLQQCKSVLYSICGTEKCF
jgi:hypothetical protein